MGGHDFPLSEATERKLGNVIIKANQYDSCGTFLGVPYIIEYPQICPEFGFISHEPNLKITAENSLRSQSLSYDLKKIKSKIVSTLI